MIKTRMDEDTQARLLGKMIDAKQKVLRKCIKPVNLRKYLKFLSDFYRFSYDNQMILYALKPDAECIAGINAWIKMGRQVKEGEEPVYIFIDSVVLDDPGEVALSEDGKQLVLSDTGIPVYTREPTYNDIVVPVPVYDISQTEKDEDIDEEEILAVETPDFYDYISAQALLVTPVDKMSESHKYENAYYDEAENEIIIKKDLPQNMYSQELLHAYVQFLFAVPDNTEKSDGAPDVRDCRYPEIAIECISWMLNEHYGLKQTIRTFGDVSVYDKEDDEQLDMDLRIISFYSQRIMHHLEGFKLSFEETSLLNSLMTNDNAEWLDDMYHRMMGQFNVPDPVKSAIGNVFEEIVTHLADEDREEIYSDRLHRMIMSYPPYKLERKAREGPTGAEIMSQMDISDNEIER